MHALALDATLPVLGYAYHRSAHERTLAGERPPRREPSTPARPLMTAAERLALAIERSLFRQRNPGRHRQPRPR